MCTIGGIGFLESFFLKHNRWRRRQVLDESLEYFFEMLAMGQDRGMDATGIVLIFSDGRTEKFASAQCAHDFIRDHGAGIRWSLLDEFSRKRIAWILSCNRAQPLPEGDSIEDKNLQPLIVDGRVGVHNGTIFNDKELFEQYSLERTTDVDSEVFLRLDAHFMKSTFYGKNGEYSKVSEGLRLEKVCKEIAGGLSFGMVDLERPRTLYLVKNFKPLYLGFYPQNDLVIFNSERKNIEKGFREIGDLFSELRLEWVKPYTGVVLSLEPSGGDGHFNISTKVVASLPEQDKNKALVICSGGMDSSTAATVAKRLHGKEVTLLHFNYGQIAFNSEARAVKAVAEEIDAVTEVVDTQWLAHLCKTPLTDTKTELPQGIASAESTRCWVPSRNLLFLSIAGAFAEAKGFSSIYSGFNLEEAGSYPDNTLEFFQQMNRVLEYGTLKRVRLNLVLERFMKAEIIKLAHHIGVPLDHTWSCDLGGEKPCGTCGCCFTRRHAHLKAGIPDNQVYLSDEVDRPIWWKNQRFKINQTPIEDLVRRAEGAEGINR